MTNIKIKRSDNDDELQTVYKLRDDFIDLEPNRMADLYFMEREKIMDQLGAVFLFSESDEVIGTIRVTPIGYGYTLTEQLLKLHNFRHKFECYSWDVGRLAVKKQCRSPQTLFSCIYLTTKYCLENSLPCEHLLSACNGMAARLYKRFGFNLIASDLSLALTDKSYSIIYVSTHELMLSLSLVAEEPKLAVA